MTRNSARTREVANPDALDQEGTQPSRARRAVLTGGALSLAAVAAGALGRTQSASAQATTQDVVALMPSNDKTGATDAANISAAFAALPVVTDPGTGQPNSVGSVLLGPGEFYVNSQIVKPPYADLIGSGPGTVINTVGSSFTGTATNVSAVIYSHNPTMSNGTVQHMTTSGTIANLVVDGTSTNNATVYGIDIGDGWGHRLEHIWIRNFTGTGSIGLSVCNRAFWTEKFYAQDVNLINNSTGAMHWTVVSAFSHEYQDVSYFIWAEPAQNGVTFQGVLWNGNFTLEGNIGVVTDGNTHWMVGLTNDVNNKYNPANPAAVKADCCINYEVNDMNQSGPNPYAFYFDPPSDTIPASTFAGSGFIRSAGGGNGAAGGPSNPAVGQFQFRGYIVEANEDLQTVTAPVATPVTKTAYPNNQNDAFVYITGGAVTQIQINNTNLPAAITSGPIFVPMNASITIIFTSQPSWEWVSAL
jgi:hypothetical protein